MATRPGACDEATITENESRTSGRGYIGVDNVVVLAADATRGTVRISARTTTGDGVFEIRWADTATTWPFCPSSLPSSAVFPEAGPVPEVGATGRLYLEHGFVTQNAILGGTPKWPKGLPGYPLTRWVSLVPRKLVLTALRKGEDGDLEEATVDLMDRTLAPPQTLVLDEGDIGVWLTQKGLAEFGLAFPEDGQVDESLLESAVGIIEEKSDADRIAEAWSVVASFDRWASSVKGGPPRGETDAAGSIERVRALLARVLAKKSATK